MTTSLMNTKFDNAQPKVEEVKALVEQMQSRIERVQSKVEIVRSGGEHAQSVTYVPQNVQVEHKPLGKGVIEFDPNADCSREAGPIERGASTAAFVALLIAAIYLVYLTVSQLFEPMIYVVTHL